MFNLLARHDATLPLRGLYRVLMMTFGSKRIRFLLSYHSYKPFQNRIIWEQDVPVIIMLTKEVESSLVKCGHYWGDGVYGLIEVKLLTQYGESEIPGPTPDSPFVLPLPPDSSP